MPVHHDQSSRTPGRIKGRPAWLLSRAYARSSALLAGGFEAHSDGQRGRHYAALPVSELSDAANVSRQLVYLQFGDRDALPIAVAVDLVERELIPEIQDIHAPYRARVLATARHFAEHRSFYRAMLTGTCAFAMTRALNGLFGSLVTAAGMREVFGDVDDATA